MCRKTSTARLVLTAALSLPTLLLVPFATNAADAPQTRITRREVEVDSGTDRGAALTLLFHGKTLYQARMEIDVSRRDVIDTFYYCQNRLLYVREQTQDYNYQEKKGDFDFAHPQHRKFVRYEFSPSGTITRIIGDPTPEYCGKSHAYITHELTSLSKIIRIAAAKNIHTLDLHDWIGN